MSNKIPKEIQDKIIGEYENTNGASYSMSGAGFGYSLAAKQIEEKDNEIERLKKENHDLYKRLCNSITSHE